jgi:transcription elongation factor GreA
MERVPLTVFGFEKLQAELKHLTSVERPNIIAAISEARSHGDLSENAEYHAAKEKQGFIEGRIAELENKLARAEVFDPRKHKGEKIVLGATVKLADVDTDKEITYVLVGPDEANSDKNLISTTSPVGRALLGKSEGDEVTVQTPGGKRGFEIVGVEFKAFSV